MQRSARKIRRGVTAVLAMMYLVLFSALSIGFFAATSMSVQIGKNDVYASRAQMAAESGLQMLRWHMNNVDVRANYDFTADPVFVAIYTQLNTRLSGTGTMNGTSVGLSSDSRTIYIPARPSNGAMQWISLDGQYNSAGSTPGGAAFSAMITHSGDKFVLKVIGRDRSTTVMRALQLGFQKAANSSTIFNFGLVSKGKIATSGSSWVEGAAGHADPLGSVLSTDTVDATPVTIAGRGVSGDISITGNGNVTYAGASVGGTTNTTLIAANHVHTNVTPPTFPDIDTTGFVALATNPFTGAANGTFSGQTYSNISIPAGKNPTFSGNTTINGVMVVYPPNKIKFLGNLKITGVIVAPASPGGTYPAFDATNNSLTFSGNVTAKDVTNLDPAVYPQLSTMTGSFILAPNFATSFTGSFGTVNGSIIAGQVTFSGAAGGTIQGSILNVEPQTLSVGGSSDVVIAGRGTSNVPTGVSFGDHLSPLPGTYDEVTP